MANAHCQFPCLTTKTFVQQSYSQPGRLDDMTIGEQVCVVDLQMNTILQASFTCPVQQAENQQISSSVSLTDLVLPPEI